MERGTASWRVWVQKLCAGEAGWEEPDYTAVKITKLKVTCDDIDNDCDGSDDPFPVW